MPPYNEEWVFPTILQKLNAVKWSFGLKKVVLIVNCGIKVNTLKIAQKFQGKIYLMPLAFQLNHWKAVVMCEGLTEAVKCHKKGRNVIVLDAYCSHNTYMKPDIILQSLIGNDILLISRFYMESRIFSMVRIRKIISSVAGYIFHIFAQIKNVRDYTLNQEAYCIEVLTRVMDHFKEDFIFKQVFGYTTETLLNFDFFSLIIYEVPFNLHYELKQRECQMKVIKTVKQTLGILMKPINTSKG
jgi:hypothetical protein